MCTRPMLPCLRLKLKAFSALPSDPERAYEVVQRLVKVVEKAVGPKEVVEDKLTNFASDI